MTTAYTLGLDIGQATDPSALAIVEHTTGPNPDYRLRHLHRYPLGTLYPDLVTDIASLLGRTPLAGCSRIAIDATGVGRPIVDLFRQKLPGQRLHAITITGGTSSTRTDHGHNVPKRDLIQTTTLLLQQHRLRIVKSLPDTEALIDELLDFRRTLSDTGHDSYAAATGAHDDLVLALSLALWTAEHHPAASPYRRAGVPRGRIPGIDDILRRSNLHRHT